MIEGYALSAVCTALFLSLATYMYMYLLRRRRHAQCSYPPGPFSFPVVGNLIQMGWSGSLQSFLDYNRIKFGNIFTIEFGGTKQVVVSGYDNIHNLLVKNADYSSNRSPKGMPESFEVIARETPGLIWAPFPHWKMLRSFALNVLRDEGMGSQSLEIKILKEAEEFCKFFIEPNLGRNIDLTGSIPKATNNIISEMIFGGRSEYDDLRFNEMIESLERIARSSLIAAITKNIPLLKYIPKLGVTDQRGGTELSLAEMKGRLEEHKVHLDVNNPVDIFDEFLIHRLKHNVDSNCFTDGNAAVMASQLYIAGSETTSTALRWALLYTCLHPDAQCRVKKEIDDVIGLDRCVNYSDRNSMPYTSAVLQETLRLANIVPMSLPHVLDKEMVVNGQKIPSGSILMLNMASVLHDKEIFENPEIFDPERYLTGDVRLKNQRTIPFGTGRRVCLGESLARMELFLFYVSLMQKYDAKLAEGKRYSTQPQSSLVNPPQPYDIVFTSRT